MMARAQRWFLVSIGVVAVLAVGFVGPSGAVTTPFSFALIGDVPYSSSDVAAIGQLVTDIDNAAGVEFVAHAGDIKSATQVCSDSVIGQRFAALQAFDDPFWYTPGDNEWIDCRLSDPSADPLERLAYLRSVFYPNPNRTTGGTSMAVTPQSGVFVENVSFRRQCVTFGSIHQIGSGNGDLPWPGETPAEKKRREAEVGARVDANAAWVDAIFDRAEAAGSSGVFILVQAKPIFAPRFTAVTNRIVERAGAFDGQVVIAHGNDHTQETEPNFLGLANVTRWEVLGGDDATGQWVKASVDCTGSATFSQAVVQTGTTPPTLPPTTSPNTSTTSTVVVSPPDPLDRPIERGATAGRKAERGEQFTLSP